MIILTIAAAAFGVIEVSPSSILLFLLIPARWATELYCTYLQANVDGSGSKEKTVPVYLAVFIVAQWVPPLLSED